MNKSSSLDDSTPQQLALGNNGGDFKPAAANRVRIKRTELRELDTYKTHSSLLRIGRLHATKPWSGLIEQL